MPLGSAIEQAVAFEKVPLKIEAKAVTGAFGEVVRAAGRIEASS